LSRRLLIRADWRFNQSYYIFCEGVIALGELSPMMKQYLEIKKSNPDALLFFRLGDFYEMFFDDAKTASAELELVLTGRDCGLEERAPMCGVPFHSYENYVARLVAKGYKVAICEQLEDPAQAKGLVKRDIVRVITPGTVIESSMLDETKNNYIACIYTAESKEKCGVCFADISTGELCFTELQGEDIESRLADELIRFNPSEVLFNRETVAFKGIGKVIKDRLTASADTLDDFCFEEEKAFQLIEKQFSQEQINSISALSHPHAIRAVGALIEYLKATQKNGIERLDNIEHYFGDQFMRLDAAARRNLELIETMRNKEKKGSLLWVLDRTKTAMGKRMIRRWIEQPLVNPSRIQGRLNAVSELVSNDILRGDIIESMTGLNDLERLMTRVVYGSAGARELNALSFTLKRMPSIKSLLENVSSQELRSIYEDIDTLEDITQLIEAAIVDDPPITVREGGIIREGFSADVDELREDMNGGRGFITKLEAGEREKTGIPKLKIGYNRVFGYYIEVTNSYKDQVPEGYIRKQTLANCERYITQELKEMESRVLGAQDRLVKLEYQLFEKVRSVVADALTRVQTTAHALARLDVYCSFANVSVTNRYTRPLVNTSGRIILTESRHPVVEALLDVPFVPNAVMLDNDENRVAIITGPNMAGKSTYMRQIALITLMAQIGCFVPADSAEIGVVDGIYTRVGAADDLSVGQSTFMVEMTEVADILANATGNSLLILDEIGRGTSTFDGMSIARAVVEYIADKRKLGAKTLFATHYHELTSLEAEVGGVKNYNIAAKKNGENITFLRRIVRGGADESYGIEVAKLAGVPNWVLKKARAILKQLESGDIVKSAPVQIEQTSFSLTPPEEQEVIYRLKNTDINKLTPIDAFTMLNELINLIS